MEQQPTMHEYVHLENGSGLPYKLNFVEGYNPYERMELIATKGSNDEDYTKV